MRSPFQCCLPMSAIVFPQIFINILFCPSMMQLSQPFYVALFKASCEPFQQIPPHCLWCVGVSPTPNRFLFLGLEPAWNQQLRLWWSYTMLTLNILTLILVQIEISILNEPAATRTWLSLSESTEEFFMWSVCQADSPTLTTETWQCCILEFPLHK
jgi:hypothetical protein